MLVANLISYRVRISGNGRGAGQLVVVDPGGENKRNIDRLVVVNRCSSRGNVCVAYRVWRLVGMVANGTCGRLLAICMNMLLGVRLAGYERNSNKEQERNCAPAACSYAVCQCRQSGEFHVALVPV